MLWHHGGVCICLKIHEKEIYAQRQSILEEIEILRKREAEVKRASEGNERFAIYISIEYIWNHLYNCKHMQFSCIYMSC